MELAKIVRDLLKPFLFVTKLLSSENQTTLDMVLHVSLYLRHKITTFECENENTESVKSLLLNSFNFYMEKYEIWTNQMIVTACFLNPNYRSFKFGTEDEKKDFNNVSKAYLLKLYKTHYSSYSENEPEKVPSTPFSAASNESFFCKESTEETSESKSNLENEIVLYLKDDYLDELSKYWISKKSVYPILFKLARIILTCPGTSVPSERLFSNASDQMWAKRNRLSSSSFEKLMLIYSSLKI